MHEQPDQIATERGEQPASVERPSTSCQGVSDKTTAQTAQETHPRQAVGAPKSVVLPPTPPRHQVNPFKTHRIDPPPTTVTATKDELLSYFRRTWRGVLCVLCVCGGGVCCVACLPGLQLPPFCGSNIPPAAPNPACPQSCTRCAAWRSRLTCCTSPRPSAASATCEQPHPLTSCSLVEDACPPALALLSMLCRALLCSNAEQRLPLLSSFEPCTHIATSTHLPPSGTTARRR